MSLISHQYWAKMNCQLLCLTHHYSSESIFCLCNYFWISNCVIETTGKSVFFLLSWRGMYAVCTWCFDVNYFACCLWHESVWFFCDIVNSVVMRLSFTLIWKVIFKQCKEYMKGLKIILYYYWLGGATYSLWELHILLYFNENLYVHNFTPKFRHEWPEQE